ncbi:Pimeloyl-ACP methyl ester carboxylesterase [Micromonospora viridifaciens]|uniref:Pimeloyl-ACP methyl ester carboxylesterase n=1 Tax=Micromonospora viridifaciens TaxID=1881 RepID=A0A1C4X5A1_MICVI|nr:alpha/beta fold hydrolase [Micromonospora viridifaciens]SCF03612.1 Pimeloyl-ACP methyl ester carboxylesterase [Micromonospora viridifaciens]
MTWRLLAAPGAAPVAGRGRVVAAVHGLADNGSTWQELATRLGAGYRWYAVDAPWSADPDGSLRDGAGPARWLRQALAAVPEPVDILVGHSFGANAVLDHLATRPEPAVRAAVLIAPLVRPEDRAPHPVLIARTRAAIRQVVADGLRARLGPRATQVADDVLAAMVDKAVARVPDGAAEVVLDRLLATPRPALGRVGTPTLVLAGRSDQRLAGVRADSLAVMPAVEVRIHQHHGHFCHITEAAEVAAECAEFLDRVVPAPSPTGPTLEVVA